MHQLILARQRGAHAGSSLRFIRSASSKLHEATLLGLEETYGVPCLEAYGMTEASPQIASNPLPAAPRPARLDPAAARLARLRLGRARRRRAHRGDGRAGPAPHGGRERGG